MMSEENMNNSGQQEETAALFINAQKKKKAEEEARKRAEEEQAKRDAAEAEVRRIEQELEEQRRKAEEERLALEEAEKAKAQQALKANIKEGIKEGLKDAKSVIATAASEKKKSMNPVVFKILVIGGSVILVAAIVIGVIFAIKNKGKAIDYSEIEADGKYTIKEDGYDLEFAYPEDVYTDVSEKADDTSINISFESENRQAPTAVITMIASEDTAPALQFDVNKTLDELEEVTKAYIDDGDIIDDSTTKISNDPDHYLYKATYQMDEDMFGAVAGWYTVNDAGNVFFTAINTFGKGKDEESAENMLDLFMSENMDNALKTPGAYPIDKYDWDGSIGIEQVNFKVPISKERFQELKEYNSEGERVYVDKNGAIIVLAGVNIAEKDGFAIYEDQTQNYYDMFKRLADEGLSEVKAENRMFLSNTDSPFGYVDSFNEYKTIYNGIDYWERDYAVVWEGKDAMYIAIVYTYVPMESKDKYKDILDKSIESLETY